MARLIIYSLLIAAFLGQGWAQAGVLSPETGASPADCMGQMSSDADCGCCPDGMMSAGACGAVCSVALALASAAPEIAVSRGQVESAYFPSARAGPRYLPLTPPPRA